MIIKIVFTVVPSEDIAIVVRWRTVVKGFGQNVVKKELTGFFVVDPSRCPV
tara:strand:+ start:379 stop:531 length:153 start_codon:yes stop_codon:yes gene_type:complete